LRSGLWLPLFDELADPAAVARLAVEAQDAGWDGIFVWDHVRWREPIRDVADPWITLAAVAAATETIRLGPMVTPLARRRPVKVARETATLDQLGEGRLILGVGLGEDRFGAELSKTGEQLDDRARGEMLDESLDILSAAWSGEMVRHRGTTTSLTVFSSCLVPFKNLPFRFGSRRIPETLSRCDGRPATTASFRSVSKAWISSLRPWRPSATCVAITRRLMTSLLNCLPEAMSPPTLRRARLGG
jgi:alkanesulfonate monooxygenase SsuD/methylene tetrahydromethanopterin reductase-like flavin-dependent oxidoreductase (luciferase family)